MDFDVDLGLGKKIDLRFSLRFRLGLRFSLGLRLDLGLGLAIQPNWGKKGRYTGLPTPFTVMYCA